VHGMLHVLRQTAARLPGNCLTGMSPLVEPSFYDAQVQDAAILAFVGMLPVLSEDEQLQMTSAVFENVEGTADEEHRAAAARAAADTAARLPAGSRTAHICLRALLDLQQDSDNLVREVLSHGQTPELLVVLSPSVSCYRWLLSSGAVIC